ncbi:LOW QUALITY PROTEIN: hypothetical protein KUTeg_001863 [Tegillarca granosa]|uniref:Uncharacterized protein n=1 Tax=Tegillarca granosa TaxID=220873 RepID=A0ABQ9FVV5_TEGGR|nr:LOW QUALITY PROTEIN: hypothetical protein KUTeg_001863 [Tegillarca granosa]
MSSLNVFFTIVNTILPTFFFFVDGGWGSWGPYSPCSAVCGSQSNGFRYAQRYCTNPAPQYNGRDCTGDKYKYIPCSPTCSCNAHYIIVKQKKIYIYKFIHHLFLLDIFVLFTFYNPQLTERGQSGAAGNTVLLRVEAIRIRNCDNPPKATIFGKDCEGDRQQQQTCNTQHCPNTVLWSKEYGNDQMIHKAFCECIIFLAIKFLLLFSMSSKVLVKCLERIFYYQCLKKTLVSFIFVLLFIDGGWTSWSVYSPCTQTCGTGSKSRTRTCSSPPPRYNGKVCSGASLETATCNTNHCPGIFFPWTLCYNSFHEEQCLDREHVLIPSPEYGGALCIGFASETMQCNAQNCPIDGNWGE